MVIKHQVIQGESIARIAYQYGFGAIEPLLNHPDNAHFKDQCADGDALPPGGVVTVPKPEPKTFRTTTEGTVNLVIKAPTVRLFFVIENVDGEVMKNARYVLHVGSSQLEGTSNGQGEIDEAVPLTAEQARLEVWPEEDNDSETKDPFVWELAIGHLDPLEEPTGIQARLNNLGFDCGRVDGDIGVKTEAALRSFQANEGIEEDDPRGQDTLAALKNRYGR